MKIAIIVAMQKELNLLLPHIEDQKRLSANDFTFVSGRLGRHDVVAVRCGIGKVNAAVGTLTLIDIYHPDLVINTGVAGGTGGGAGILDVVVADRIAYHDVWCGPGTEPGQAAGCPLFFESPLTAEFVAQTPDAKRGLIVSGDIFVAKKEDVERIKALFPQAMACDMESGAIAQVCHIKNVPFVCLRVISDTPGAADNIAQYENFWDDAPRHTFKALTNLVDRL